MKHRRVLSLLSSAFAASVGLLVFACGTDNGESVHGPTFGPLDQDGGPPSSSSGSGGPSDGAVPPGDGSLPDGEVGESGPGPCTSGTVAVLAGSDTALGGAIQDKGGAWAGASIGGGSALSKPALVAFGQGFLGVTRGSGNTLLSTTYATSWSAAAAVGAATGVKGPPSLAVAGTKAYVVYSGGPGQNTDFMFGIDDGTGWNTADATVGTTTEKSFGTIGAGLAGAGNTVVFMENGKDHGLYTRTYDGAWSTPSAISGAGTIGNDLPAPPVLVESTGAVDLVAVYVEQDTTFAYATRAGGTWTSHGVVQALAKTSEPFSVARIGAATFIIAFRGQDGNGYYAQGLMAGAGAIAWNAAQAIGGAGNVAVDSAPAVAKGVCGDDAIVVYASGGTVKATRLRGPSWTTPETIAGASGSRVAVVTK